jgi:GNAT superfamily N-acetyltransferase
MQTVELGAARNRAEELQALNDSTWPEFLLHGDVRNWSSLYDRFADFQLLLLEKGDLVGAGLTVPLSWQPEQPTPETIDEVLVSARWPLGRGPGVLCALAALVAPEHRGRGLSRRIVREMCGLAARKGLSGVLAPVRPTRKHEYPHESIERYVGLREDTGRTLDPWLRVHRELGGRELGFARRALTVRGTVSEWQTWTGRRFTTSGEHVVSGALVPVRMDLDSDVGEYVEPNVWYFHPVGRPESGSSSMGEG